MFLKVSKKKDKKEISIKQYNDLNFITWNYVWFS